MNDIGVIECDVSWVEKNKELTCIKKNGRGWHMTTYGIFEIHSREMENILEKVHYKMIFLNDD